MTRIGCIYYTWKKVEPGKQLHQANFNDDDDENNDINMTNISNLQAAILFLKRCIAKERICVYVGMC